METTEKYADKIAKLLRKAENTDSQAEAEAFLAKAQELMTLYAIDEMMIARARGDVEKTREEIIQRAISYTGIFKSVLMSLGNTVIRHNDCRGVYMDHNWEKPKRTVLTVTGFESDVDRACLIESSIQLQCASALAAWWKQQDASYLSNMERFKARREFILGFTSGLSAKLAQANREAERQAAQAEAERSNITVEQATDSVALELRSRKDRVNDWMDNHYGRLRSSTRSYSRGGLGASGAGYAAGQAANTGSPSVGGSSRSLGR